ncbi:hypothetical protein C8Q70DRAFT_949002 [Cubamyces menziesii]|nr:hypothetical protein C8Q70DRAFT_949002 [Cubamyces menziesii]
MTRAIRHSPVSICTYYHRVNEDRVQHTTYAHIGDDAFLSGLPPRSLPSYRVCRSDGTF